MNPIFLYINNFHCHTESLIDFSLFNSAVITGRYAESDLYSNGVGKSTIFKALEYVLFGQSDCNLEKIIRDGESSATIIFDFSVADKTYRITRVKTKKASDVNLYLATSTSLKFNVNCDEKEWKNISGRRSSDTEQEIAKLLKINFAIFKSTVHFAQLDMSGLPTATSSKRKSILKDIFQLGIYSKLEKMAKENFSNISKEVSDANIILSHIKDPQQEILNFTENLISLNQKLNEASLSVKNAEIVEKSFSDQLKEKQIFLAEQKKDFDSITFQISKDKITAKNLQTTIDSNTSKKNAIVMQAKDLTAKIEKNKKELQSISDDIKNINEQFLKEIIDNNTKLLNENKAKYLLLSKELDILNNPMPTELKCPQCRSSLTEEHRENCKKEIINEKEIISIKQKEINEDIVNLNKLITDASKDLDVCLLKHKQMDKLTNIINMDSKEISSKKSLHKEYTSTIGDLKVNLDTLAQEIITKEKSLEKIDKSSFEKINEEINSINLKLTEATAHLLEDRKSFNEISQNIAIINNNISQKEKDLIIKNEKEKIIENNKELSKLYPLLIEAFSSAGIPNLMIQNILNDLQAEANTIIPNFHAGLQLEFAIEKTRSDGAQDDTLDINYYLHNKPRDFEQLSGAQKLAAIFGLKLGLLMLLKKMFDVDFNLLLLDEVDQALDKASLDAFATNIKSLDQQFKILIITHNDRLKEKFSNVIEVNQDMEKNSHAEVKI